MSKTVVEYFFQIRLLSGERNRIILPHEKEQHKPMRINLFRNTLKDISEPYFEMFVTRSTSISTYATDESIGTILSGRGRSGTLTVRKSTRNSKRLVNILVN